MSKVTIGAGIGIALGLAGIAFSITDYNNDALARWLLIAAAVVLVGCTVISVVRSVRTRYDHAVERRVEQVVSAKLAELQRAPEPQRPEPPPGPIPVRASLITADADLRAAVNHVIGELQDAAEHIRADDHSFWEGNYLPTYEWGRFSDQIARKDDEAYQDTRAAYREIERIERCMKDQRIGDGMGGVWLPDNATVVKCTPEAALRAITQAVARLRKLSRTA